MKTLASWPTVLIYQTAISGGDGRGSVRMLKTSPTAGTRVCVCVCVCVSVYVCVFFFLFSDRVTRVFFWSFRLFPVCSLWVCVCMHERACVRACVCVRSRACMRVNVGVVNPIIRS